MKYYLHKGCLIAILFLSTLFYPFTYTYADTFKVGFNEVSGHGVYADIVKIDNIKVEFIDPFDNNRVIDVANYTLYFKVCDTFEGSNRISLRPGLTEEKITCLLTNRFDFTNSNIVHTSTNGFTLDNVYTPEGNCSVDLRFDKNTLFLNQINVCFPRGVNYISIFLKWRDPPRDLDAHLTGPNCNIRTDNNCNENNRFHIYFANRQNEVARLNAAEFSDSTPEYIDIYPDAYESTLRPGLYRFTTHHFVGRDGKISDSDAEIVVSLCKRDGSCEQSGVFTPPHDDSNVLQGESDSWITLEFKIGRDGTLEGIWAPTTPYYANVHPDDVW